MAKKFVSKCARKHNTCRLFPQMVSLFPATVTTNSGKRVTSPRSRGFLDQWLTLTKKRAPLMSLLEERLVYFALVVLAWGVLSIPSLCSCDLAFKQQAVMAISGKSVDEVRSWLTDNGFAADNLVLSTELIMWINHRKEIRKLTFRALALRFAPTKG